MASEKTEKAAQFMEWMEQNHQDWIAIRAPFRHMDIEEVEAIEALDAAFKHDMYIVIAIILFAVTNDRITNAKAKLCYKALREKIETEGLETLVHEFKEMLNAEPVKSDTDIKKE